MLKSILNLTGSQWRERSSEILWVYAGDFVTRRASWFCTRWSLVRSMSTITYTSEWQLKTHISKSIRRSLIKWKLKVQNYPASSDWADWKTLIETDYFWTWKVESIDFGNWRNSLRHKGPSHLLNSGCRAEVVGLSRGQRDERSGNPASSAVNVGIKEIDQIVHLNMITVDLLTN